MNRDRVCFGREAAEGAARSMMATEGESPPLKTVCNHAIHSQHEMSRKSEFPGGQMQVQRVTRMAQGEV